MLALRALPQAPVAAQIAVLEELIRISGEIEVEPVHRFADGLYAREITFPAGCLATSRIHKTKTISIISSGSISVFSEAGGIQHIKAPHTFIGEPGMKFVGYAHEETTWTCFFATDLTDVGEIEDTLMEPEPRHPGLDAAVVAALREASLCP